MTGVTVTWETLLMAVVLATVVYLLEVVLFSRRRGKSTDKQDSLKELDLDLDAMHARMTELERQVRALREQLQELKRAGEQATQQARQAETQATPYAQAVQLARQGLNSQELAHRCGITNGEAELIVALNRGET